MITAIICFSLAAILSVVLVFYMNYAIPFNGKEITKEFNEEEKLKIEDCINLEKDPSKDFVIMNLSDIHFTWNSKKAFIIKMTNYIKSLIDEVNPDLITISGDMVWKRGSKIAVKKFCKMMNSFNVSWAAVLGNHDAVREDGNDPSWMFDQLLGCNNCLAKKGYKNVDGFGNYIINIKEENKIIYSLIMMDSHGDKKYEELPKLENKEEAIVVKYKEDWLCKDGFLYKPNGNEYKLVGKSYDYLKESQVEWYKWAINGLKELNNDITPNSTIIMHMPIPEYAIANAIYTEDVLTDKDGKALDEEDILALENGGSECFGKAREEVSCAYYNSGLFKAIKEGGSKTNIVVGHDHLNNSSCLYDGVRFTYALKCGDVCYHDDRLSGATIMKIDNEGNLKIKHIYKLFN